MQCLCWRYLLSFKHIIKFRIFWDVAQCSHVKFYRRFRVLTASIFIALMMETVHTSETSVNFNVTTRHYIPEELHARRRENLKSHT
jgi:hypothetical protein